MDNNLLEIKAILAPKYLTLRFDDKRISVQYHVNEAENGAMISEALYINFTPSNELMQLLKKEVDLAVINKSLNP